MNSPVTRMVARARSGWLALLLMALALAMPAAAQAMESSVNCNDAPYNGVVDGNIFPVPPANLTADGNCTIRNYPSSNPFTANMSFHAPGGGAFLVVFDNVEFAGSMSCNSNDTHRHKIWFVNGAFASKIHESCRSLFIPVEKIDKRNPVGSTTAAVGVPFTYKLVIPILYDPFGGIVVDSQGSPNDLHSVIVTDDLNATGVDLSYVSHNVYWRDSGVAVPHVFTNESGLLTFDFSGLPIVPAGDQLVIDVTVVLDDSPVNAIGTSFINTATWQFGRYIEGVFYTPLPGENGISPPLTIGAPNVTVAKSGPATLNLGTSGTFTVDAFNSGSGDAWNIELLDRLPEGAGGGMCDMAPVVQAVTRGGTPLVQGTHFTVSFAGTPACEMRLHLLDAAGPLPPGQHLIVTYTARLDADTVNGAVLTNVAGTTAWYNGASTIAERVQYARTVTNGTEGVTDHQDSHTLTATFLGNFFEKTVANLTSGADPATVAVPGDTLRYTLRVRTTTTSLLNFTIHDELDALNALAGFVPGSLTLVSALPPGAVNGSSATGGAKGTGVVHVSGINLAAGSTLVLQFDIQVAPTVPNGTLLTNQSQLLVGGSTFMVSDDPNVNAQADPFVNGDEDPTRVLVGIPDLRFEKTVASGATAAPGDVVRYRLRITNMSNLAIAGLALLDEIDALNSQAQFVPGTLQLVSGLPAGAMNMSNASGGAKASGLLDLRSLSIGAAGSATGVLTLEFTAQLAPVIGNGTVVLNQGSLRVGSIELRKSDDPALAGSEDPTPLTIASSPVLRVLKRSDDLSPPELDILRAGDTLRYTITVQNIGNANASDASLRDLLPANTTYVAGSTTLNGAPVADIAGASPLTGGMAINSPGQPAGTLLADAAATPATRATVTFDVVVDATAADGTVVSNQGFASAPGGGVVDVPSDDPDTPIIDDPTRDVVGPVPLLYAEKSAVLVPGGDLGTPGVVNPGDTLRYTIRVYNTGNAPLTGAVLADMVPANTTYVADSVTLNGLPAGGPDGGVSPLVAGLDISSSDLAPPLAGQGTLSPGQAATVQFDLRVNDGVAEGTLISNQATVRGVGLVQLLTDGDGNPATGPEPTIVVVGPGQRLAISKQVAVVGGGPAVAGAELEYLVRVTNIGAVPATYVRITDDLDTATPGYLIYEAGTARLDGATAGITEAGQVITADFFGTYGVLAPGQTTALRFRARIAQGLANGTRTTNVAVAAWGNPANTITASASIDVGAIAGVAMLNGQVWHDGNANALPDGAERKLEGWTVDLYRNGQLVRSTQTDASGAWQISGVAPNYVSLEPLELRFTAPGAGITTAKLGRAYSPFTNDLHRIADIITQPGSNLLNLNLPIEPNGVIYNTMSRLAIAGASITMLDATSRAALPASCFLDPAQQGQVTQAFGYYRFDLDFNDPACPSGGTYLLQVTPPSDDYLPAPSGMIPPVSGTATAAFSVPSCPASAGDAVPATSQRCEVQVSEFAPGTSVPGRTPGTAYHLHLLFNDSFTPGSSQVFNNHIPLDPDLTEALAISKTTPLLNVTRGQLVPYVITLGNISGIPLSDVRLADRFPPGFRYVPGSARLDKVPAEPTLAGQELSWTGLVFSSTGTRTVTLLLAVGAGVGEGEFTNRAQGYNGLTGAPLSGEATATVRVVPDPTFDCTDVIGKVFDDANRNGRQDGAERGLPGVRLVSARGLAAITDAQGRYHLTCAITPNEQRGSNFVLKLDDRTLPSGYRASTDELRVARATRGKALKLDFSASIHRTVGLDLADDVFEPGTTQMRVQWRGRMPLLMEELLKAPSVLRLSYLADVEDPSLVERRLRAIKEEIMNTWRSAGGGYRLVVEPEVFWRRGGPPDRSAARGAGK